MCTLCELAGPGFSATSATTLHSSASNATQPIIGVYDAGRTGNPYIDGVISGYKWPAGTAIHYGFPTTTAPYPSPYGGYTDGAEYNQNFVPVSQFAQETFDAFITGVRSGSVKAMTLTPIMGFTNLTLVKDAAPTADTHMLIATSSAPSTAWAYYPGERFGNREGDVWLGQSYAEYVTPANGSYGNYIMLHEFGHALGLKHSFDLNEPEDVTVPFDGDFREYTIMTYSGAPYVTPTDGVAGPEADFYYTYPQTFMMLDVAALQQMYGANYSFSSEGNTYTWSTTTGEAFIDGVSQGRAGATDGTTTFIANKIFQTIWDGDGIDTYDLSNYSTNLKLNLAPGGYSTFSDAQRVSYGYFPYPEVWYARGNVYNALLHNNDLRSLIENAKGGSGNDHIEGNLGGNQLLGNAGKDTLIGAAGDDILDGGDFIDTAVFSGARSDYVITANSDGSFTIVDVRDNGDGKDTLISINFAKFSDQVVTLADPGFTLTGTARSETLKGDIGNDKLYGLAGNDVLNGGAGADTMIGGTGNDTHYVDNAGDQVIETATGGTADKVITSISHTLAAYVENLTASGTGAVTLTGNGLANALSGNAARNTLNGGAGHDRLNGGWGSDVLSGGTGRDVFIFKDAPNRWSNMDTITDFSVADDTLWLDNAVFTKLFNAKTGTLHGALFKVSAKALDANDYVLYDKATGYLRYDADGSGAGAAITFAKLAAGLTLTSADFVVI
jgi:serralysin